MRRFGVITGSMDCRFGRWPISTACIGARCARRRPWPSRRRRSPPGRYSPSESARSRLSFVLTRVGTVSMFLRKYEQRLAPQLSSELGEPILRCIALNTPGVHDRMLRDGLPFWRRQSLIVNGQPRTKLPQTMFLILTPTRVLITDIKGRLPAGFELTDPNASTWRCRDDRGPRRRVVAVSPEVPRRVGVTGLGTGLRARHRRRIGRPAAGVLGHTTG